MVKPLRPLEDTGKLRTGPHRGGAKQKYFLSDWQRRLLLERYDGRTTTIDELMQYFPGVPRAKVRQWACDLGIARKINEVRWSQEDEDYLRKSLHKQSLRAIAKKLGRTQRAVSEKAKKLDITKTQEGYTMTGLCQGLGCDHKKVEKWLDKGWLKGTRRKSEMPRDMWLFQEKDIKEFIRHHPEELNPKRFDWLWLADIIFTLGPLGEPPYTQTKEED